MEVNTSGICAALPRKYIAAPSSMDLIIDLPAVDFKQEFTISRLRHLGTYFRLSRHMMVMQSKKLGVMF